MLAVKTVSKLSYFEAGCLNVDAPAGMGRVDHETFMLLVPSRAAPWMDCPRRSLYQPIRQ